MCGVCGGWGGGWGGGRSLKVVCFLSGDLITGGMLYKMAEFKCGCYNCLFTTIYVLAYFPVVALYVCMLLVFSFCLFVLCLDCCNKYNTCRPRRHNFVPQL